MEHKITSKKIIYFLILVVLCLCGVYYFVFSDIKSKNENISKLSNELSFQMKTYEYMAEMQRAVNDADEDITLVDNSIIPADGDVEFIENLELIAKNNGLTITIDSLVFEEEASVKDASMTVLKVKAKTEGGWTGTYKFLSQIESMPLKIKINNFGLVTDKGDEVEKTSSPWKSSFEILLLKYK